MYLGKKRQLCSEYSLRSPVVSNIVTHTFSLAINSVLPCTSAPRELAGPARYTLDVKRNCKEAGRYKDRGDTVSIVGSTVDRC